MLAGCIPLPLIPSRQGRGNRTFYEFIVLRFYKRGISVIKSKTLTYILLQVLLLSFWGEPVVKETAIE